MVINFTIPDAQAPRLVNAFCNRYNYPTQVLVDGNMVNNPESRAAFSKRMLLNVLKELVLSQEQMDAAQTARAVGAPEIT